MSERLELGAKQLETIPAKLNLLLSLALAYQKGPGIYLGQVARLLYIWGSSGIIAFITVMIIYTLFFGYNRVVLDQTIYENHRYVGEPNTQRLSTSEGYGLTSYGEHGLVVNKKLDFKARRLLFIGDSFVQAVQVSDQEKFTEILEHEWNKSYPDKPIQSLNLGLGGQETETYLSFSPNMDKHFQPDLVFIILNQNDFSSLAQDPVKLNKVRQGLTGEPLVEPESYPAITDFINWLGIRSFFGQLQAQTSGFLAKGGHQTDVEAARDKQPLKSAAVEIQLKALKEMWGERLVIVYVMWFSDMGRGDPPPTTHKDIVLREIEEQAIPVINLYPVLWQAFRAQKPPFGFNNSKLGTGHLNQYGHQLVAAEIMNYLADRP